MTASETIRYYWQRRYAGLLNRTAPLLAALQYRWYRRRLERLTLPTNPLFVIGFWRTGTTLMHELLALDPRHRVPSTYEALYAPHFLLTERWFKDRLRPLAPKTRPQDQMPFDFDLPQEDEFALLTLGAPSPYQFWGSDSGRAELEAFVRLLEVDRLTAEERRLWLERWTYFLRCLLLRRPGRLVLKSPAHTCRLRLLKELFPDAKFIYMVRDPRAVAPSFLHTVRALVPDKDRFDRQGKAFAEITRLMAHFHSSVEAPAKDVPDNRFVTIKYEDFVADPTGTLRRVYEQLELGGFGDVEPLFAESVRARAAYRTNRHRISPEQLESIRQHAGPFAERHGYSLDGTE